MCGQQYHYKPDLPLEVQCGTFKTSKCKIIDEDKKFIALCSEEETTPFDPESPRNPYRDVLVLPKGCIKKIRRYKA